MNKNLITGLGVLAVAGVAYYFWRRSQLVLAKEKENSNKSVDTTNVIATTTTKSEFYGQEKLESPSIGVKEYPLGRYFNVNRMVDEANY
jgi:hypothetical protein